MAVRKGENTTLNGHSSHSVIHGHVFRGQWKDDKKTKKRGTGKIFKQFGNLFSELKAQPLSGNSLISFCTVKFKNIQIFYQNSIAVSETHVYVKASSSATQATCTSAPRIK